MNKFRSIAIVTAATVSLSTPNIEATGRHKKHLRRNKNSSLGVIDLADNAYEKSQVTIELEKIMSPTGNIKSSEKTKFIAQALTADEGAHRRHARAIIKLETASKDKNHILHKTALEVRNNLILLCQQTISEFSCNRVIDSPNGKKAYEEQLAHDCIKAITADEKSICASDEESKLVRTLFEYAHPGLWGALHHDILGICTTMQNDLGIGN